MASNRTSSSTDPDSTEQHARLPSGEPMGGGPRQPPPPPPPSFDESGIPGRHHSNGPLSANNSDLRENGFRDPQTNSPGPFKPQFDDQLAAGSYRPGGPTRPTNGDWQEAAARAPQDHSPGPFKPQFDDQPAAGSYRPGGPTRPTNGDWQEAAARAPEGHSPGPFNPQPDDQLAAGSYRPGGPTRPTNGDWQEASARDPGANSQEPSHGQIAWRDPDVESGRQDRNGGSGWPLPPSETQQASARDPQTHSPGPFNPTEAQTLAHKSFDEQDPFFISEGGHKLPKEVEKLAESLKASGKYDGYDRDQIGNIAAAAFNGAGGKFTPTDVVQVANGQFVAVGGDPQSPSTPRTDPIDPKTAAATPAQQSLAEYKPPQESQQVAQTNDLDSPSHKSRSV